MTKSNVTVFLEVYNEEARIESCLKSFTWAEELIVFDKQSTDRTREIAKRYATQVITVPFSLASENVVRNMEGRATCEWVMVVTASSLIHPHLVDEIVKLTTDREFGFDVIGMPYAMYAFGINSRNSPWSGLYKRTLIRRSVFRVSNKLHREVGYSSDRIYDMPSIGKEEKLYHCTHRDVLDFFDRTNRYARYEGEQERSRERRRALRCALKEMMKAVYILIRRRTLMLGWDGIALSMAFLCNYMMTFLYVWDCHRDNGNIVYPQLRSKLDKLWEERNAG